jgi:threonine dehydratase
MLDNLIRTTPLLQLSLLNRSDIYLKLESEQFGGSFKARGIVTFLKSVKTLNGLVAFTTGNHGVATAAVGKALNIPCIIVSSDHITPYKKMLIESYGAKLVVVNFYSLELSIEFAVNIADKKNYTFITLFGNEHLLEGYSSIADELFEDFDAPFSTFLPVGTGSLALANSRKLKAIDSCNRTIAIEPYVYQRLSTDKIEEHKASASIADSLAIDKIPSANLSLLNYIDDVMRITEGEMLSAMKLIYRNHGLIVEAGSAITLAAALKTESNQGAKVALITGRNIDPDIFNQYTNHGRRTSNKV